MSFEVVMVPGTVHGPMARIPIGSRTLYVVRLLHRPGLDLAPMPVRVPISAGP